jgi:hypothetical protein
MGAAYNKSHEGVMDKATNRLNNIKFRTLTLMQRISLIPAESTLFGVLAASLLLLSFAQAWWNPIQDPDLFWQLWAGRQLLAGQLPTVNGFSWTAPQTPWTHHEPLVALSYAAAGLDNVGFLRGLIVSATAVLLTFLAWRKQCAWATVFAISWVILLIVYGRTERALTWGNFLLALLALVLYRVDARHRWRMPLSAAIVALWANVHGSFIIGIMMVGLVNWAWGLLAAVLSLCNPNGLQLYTLLLGYGVGHDAKAFIHISIPEWRPVDLNTSIGWIHVVCLLVAGYLLISDRKWRLVLLWIVISILALRHRRFFDVLGIALLPAVSDALARRLPLRDIRHPAPILATALLIIALLSPTPVLDGTKYPIPLLAHLPSNAKLWHEFELGGWLGYNNRFCFWDSRNDCYPLSVLEDGMRIQFLRAGWLETLKHWDVNIVMTSNPDMVEQLRIRNWKEEARHGAFVLLMRPN